MSKNRDREGCKTANGEQKQPMKRRLSQMKGIVWRLSGIINIGAFSSHSSEMILFNRETELKPSRQGR